MAHYNDSSSLGQATFSYLNYLNTNQPANLTYMAVVSVKWTNTKSAYFGIAKTIFVCLVLTVGALLFSKDANEYALRPIERMIEKVKKIAKNPKKAIEEKLIQN